MRTLPSYLAALACLLALSACSTPSTPARPSWVCEPLPAALRAAAAFSAKPEQATPVNFFPAYVAPAGTPAVIASEVNGKLAHAFTQRDVTDRIAALGAEPVGGEPKRLAEHLNSEIPKWRAVVKAANIRL